MSASIALYPLLTEDMVKQIGLQVVDYDFEYDLHGQTRKISAKPLHGMEHVLTRLNLSDETGEWDPEKHNLRFKRTIVIPNSRILFGRHGIAPENAEIGIAVRWTSKPSRQRGVFVCEGLTASCNKTHFSIQGEFPPGILRGHFELSTMLYLKKTGTLHDGEHHLANSPGIELGVLDSMSFYLSGEGSIVPIFTVKDNGPLWRVECYWEDPRTDPFDESSFKILLNENHPDYKHLLPDGQRLSPLMREIFLSAIQIVLENVFDQVSRSEVISGMDADEGSLCMAAKYMIDTFQLDTGSRERLARSLRENLYDKIGGIDT